MSEDRYNDVFGYTQEDIDREERRRMLTLITEIKDEKIAKVLNEITEYVLEYSCGCMGSYDCTVKDLIEIFKKHGVIK